jgi:hypothetical protein
MSNSNVHPLFQKILNAHGLGEQGGKDYLRALKIGQARLHSVTRDRDDSDSPFFVDDSQQM